MLIHAAQLGLSGSEALIRGLAIPEQRLTVVLGNAVAAIIVIRQGELRLGISCGGRLAKRIEVVCPSPVPVPELAPRKAVRT